MCVCQHAWLPFALYHFWVFWPSLGRLDWAEQICEINYSQNAWKWKLKRVTVLMFPCRERWKNDFARHQGIFCKSAPYCLKAPSVGKGSLGVCWEDLSILGQNAIKNSPPLIMLLLNGVYTHCPFAFLSRIKNMNKKHRVGREILLSTAWSETLPSFLLHWPDRVQQGFLLFFAFPYANRSKQ